MTVGEWLENSTYTRLGTLLAYHHLLDIGGKIVYLGFTLPKHCHIMDAILEAIVKGLLGKRASHDAIHVLRCQTSIAELLADPLRALQPNLTRLLVGHDVCRFEEVRRGGDAH